MERYYATHQARGFQGQPLGDAYGSVLITVDGWWFTPADTSGNYGYWVRQCETVLGGTIE